jgi:hypothetical protein
MGVFEQRVLLTCIARIDSTKSIDENRVFKIFVDDILDLVDVSKKSAYLNLKNACRALSKNETIVELPGETITLNWMSTVRYVEGQGMVELRFTPEIVPFLTQIKQNFTQYKLDSVSKFKSSYSFRLYELINRWGGREYVVPVLWLRERLLLTDKYEKMVNFKTFVIDVAVKEINETSNINVRYEQIKRGRNIVAFRFIYSRKQDNKAIKSSAFVDISDAQIVAVQEVQQPIDVKINIDIFQFNDKDKQLAQNALAKVPEATQRIILDMFKSALAKGEIKYPLRYLNSLVSKFLSGDLDTTAFDNVPTPSNHFEKQTRRADKIKQTFAKHTDEIKAKLADDGHVFIQGEGTITQSEFEALGLIDKAPRTGTKSISLSDLMDKAQVQENLRKEKEITQKKVKRENDAKQPKNVADIPVSPMSEKEVAARQKILELEAELIAAGEFTGVNAMAIGEDEIAEMAKLDTVMQHFKQIAEKQK